MKTLYSKTEKAYTAKELHSLFAYESFNLQGNSAVIFCGPCNVSIDDLVDQADVKAGDIIKSDAMVHLICEIFNLELEAGILRQRLYMNIIRESLLDQNPDVVITRDGDDLFIDDKKLTVSIATLSPVSTLIHIGINIKSTGTPIPTVGLEDIQIDKETFIKTLLNKIENEETQIKSARTKVKGVS